MHCFQSDSLMLSYNNPMGSGKLATFYKRKQYKLREKWLAPCHLGKE
jgi:hypothetical protein